MNYNRKTNATVDAIGALMQAVTDDLSPQQRAKFEVEALALYIGWKIAAMPNLLHRENAITYLANAVRTNCNERRQVLDKMPAAQ